MPDQLGRTVVPKDKGGTFESQLGETGPAGPLTAERLLRLLLRRALRIFSDETGAARPGFPLAQAIDIASRGHSWSEATLMSLFGVRPDSLGGDSLTKADFRRLLERIAEDVGTPLGERERPDGR